MCVVKATATWAKNINLSYTSFQSKNAIVLALEGAVPSVRRALLTNTQAVFVNMMFGSSKLRLVAYGISEQFPLRGGIIPWRSVASMCKYHSYTALSIALPPKTSWTSFDYLLTSTVRTHGCALLHWCISHLQFLLAMGYRIRNKKRKCYYLPHLR